MFTGLIRCFHLQGSHSFTFNLTWQQRYNINVYFLEQSSQPGGFGWGMLFLNITVKCDIEYLNK